MCGEAILDNADMSHLPLSPRLAPSRRKSCESNMRHGRRRDPDTDHSFISPAAGTPSTQDAAGRNGGLASPDLCRPEEDRAQAGALHLVPHSSGLSDGSGKEKSHHTHGAGPDNVFKCSSIVRLCSASIILLEYISVHKLCPGMNDDAIMRQLKVMK